MTERAGVADRSKASGDIRNIRPEADASEVGYSGYVLI
jgi:hypothetical protein